MKHILFIFALFICAGHVAVAQESDTPATKIVRTYKDERGVRKFIAADAKLNIARGFIRRTPVAPVADDVTELSVLKMQNAHQEVRNAFVDDLRHALQAYVYVGIEDSPNGPVEVYVLMKSPEEVQELIVYNAEIFSLNCLYGPFTPESLLELSSK